MYQYYRVHNIKYTTCPSDGIDISQYERMVKHYVKHTDLGDHAAFRDITPWKRRLGFFDLNKSQVLAFFNWRDPPDGACRIRAFPYPINDFLLNRFREPLELYCLFDARSYRYKLNPDQLLFPQPREGAAGPFFDVLGCDEKEWDDECYRIFKSHLRPHTKYTTIFDLLPHVTFETHGVVSLKRC